MLLQHRETVTIKVACAIVKVSRRTIYNWIATGKVETIRTAGGGQRIFVDTLFQSKPASPHHVENLRPSARV